MRHAHVAVNIATIITLVIATVIVWRMNQTLVQMNRQIDITLDIYYKGISNR